MSVMDGEIVGLFVRVRVMVKEGVTVKDGVIVDVTVGENEGLGVNVGVGVRVWDGVGVGGGGGVRPRKKSKNRHRQHKHNNISTVTRMVMLLRSGFFDKNSLICFIIARSPDTVYGAGVGAGGGFNRSCMTAMIFTAAETIESEIDLNNRVLCSPVIISPGISPVIMGPNWASYCTR